MFGIKSSLLDYEDLCGSAACFGHTSNYDMLSAFKTIIIKPSYQLGQALALLVLGNNSLNKDQLKWLSP